MKLENTPALSIALRRAGRFAEQDGLAALLRQAGLDLAAWRQRRAAAADIEAPQDLDEGDLRVAAAVRHILNLARNETSAIGEEGSLASDQVLFALLGEAEGL